MFEKGSSTPLQKIENTFLKSNRVNLFIKREDLIHPTISGNKWRKLKYNFIEAQKHGHKAILTFGGAFSNHIAATASAANEYGFSSIGVIRGDELSPESNPTLQHAHDLGMKLYFVSRQDYKNRNEPGYLDELKRKFGDFYAIPEGGSNALAVKGCAEIVSEIEIDFDCIVTAVGTGGTLAGLSSGIGVNRKTLGISVLKSANYLDEEVAKLISSHQEVKTKNWEINHDYHLGGYAKFNDQLIQFINDFRVDNNIQLDPVYTGKMMMAIYELIEQKYFESNINVVALHTGGLQGITGFNALHGDLIKY
ncbi:pyridoxal-phosphate dependent enzyme [Reichenbachiella sp. MALMAid0571]|uniref:1-aminocyclopropane-1-carboxylate deaminase/D-cysteine desulfhydrase n=1 Tax=Reichenbachiella sp. MALMAid0571 TaxID=3143939 RepID=UPI0032E034AD